MRKISICLIFLLVILSACNIKDTDSNNKIETNYYLSLFGESNHWKMNGYEIMITPENYKAGYGELKIKEEKKGIDFLSFDVHVVSNGEDHRIQGGTVSGEENITEKTIGNIESEEKNLKNFAQIDEIYMKVVWNDGEDGDHEERIGLYNKDKGNQSILEAQ